MRRHLELCLDCRGCETACPSGVRYGRLIEPFRLAIEAGRHAAGEALRLVPRDRAVAAVSLRRAAAAGCWARCGCCSGWASTARPERLGLFRLVPGRLGRMAPLLPPPVKAGPEAAAVPAGRGAARGRGWPSSSAAWPTPCSAPRTGPRCACLQQNGCDVFVPPGQGCCGAIHFHAGDSRGARALADANLVAFELDRYDAIVVNHGGCGAMLKEYGLHWQDGLQPHRASFAAKVKDVHEFLDALGLVPPGGRIEAAATYHDACHLAHAQGITAAPRRLLAQDPRPGAARSARDRPLLRLGRHLQPQRAGDVRPPGRAEDGEHPRAPGRRSCWPPTPAACLQIQSRGPPRASSACWSCTRWTCWT